MLHILYHPIVEVSCIMWMYDLMALCVLGALGGFKCCIDGGGGRLMLPQVTTYPTQAQ